MCYWRLLGCPKGHIMRAAFSGAEEQFLLHNLLGRICTVDAEGYPHCVRVDYVYDRGQIYVGAAQERKWIKHLRRNPRVGFEIDTYAPREDGRIDWRGMLIKGDAHVLKEPQAKRNAFEALRQRHPEAPYGPDPIVVRIAVRTRYCWGPWRK